MYRDSDGPYSRNLHQPLNVRLARLSGKALGRRDVNRLKGFRSKLHIKTDRIDDAECAGDCVSN
jgi:hypothetical protein